MSQAGEKAGQVMWPGGVIQQPVGSSWANGWSLCFSRRTLSTGSSFLTAVQNIRAMSDTRIRGGSSHPQRRPSLFLCVVVKSCHCHPRAVRRISAHQPTPILAVPILLPSWPCTYSRLKGERDTRCNYCWLPLQRISVARALCFALKLLLPAHPPCLPFS